MLTTIPVQCPELHVTCKVDSSGENVTRFGLVWIYTLGHYRTSVEVMEKMNRAESEDKFPQNTDFMRASIIHQRNLFGIVTAPRSLILIRSLPQNTQNHTVPRQFYRSFWRDPSAPYTNLSEVFQRIQWPTTKEQEAEVVKGVRTAIWGERNGGMGASIVTSHSSHCQLTN